jgi:hypothetical protein
MFVGMIDIRRLKSKSGLSDKDSEEKVDPE